MEDVKTDLLQDCLKKYEEAASHADKLVSGNAANRMFYEGFDPVLEKRAGQDDVVRSALYVPILKPAIDTRVSGIVTRLLSRMTPVSVIPKDENVDSDTKMKVLNIEKGLNEQLFESGYFNDVIFEHLQGAELYKTPSVVKIDRKRSYKKRPEVTKQEESVAEISDVKLKNAVTWVNEEAPALSIQWLYPEEFLYQPNKSCLDDCDYLIHRTWMSEPDVLMMADQLDWDMQKTKNALKESREDKPKDSVAIKTSAERGDGTGTEEETDKILVAEYWVCLYEEGEFRVRQIVIIANKKIVFNKKTPWQGFKFPFVIMRSGTLPGTLDNFCSVDVAMPFQKIYNDLYNAYLDGLSYRLFPILLKQAGVLFSGGQPRIAPGEIWEATNIEGVAPLFPNMPIAPDVSGLLQAIEEKLRDILEVTDLSLGYQSNPYEKAASTKMRVMGAEGRSQPTRKRYADAIMELAKKVIAVQQQYAENKEEWVADVIVDIPALTNLSDPESEKQDLILLISQMQQSPLYANPLGMKKIRNAQEELLRLFIKKRFIQFVPSEEELLQSLEIQTKQQNEMMRKQSIGEQMGMHAQQGQENDTGNNV